MARGAPDFRTLATADAAQLPSYTAPIYASLLQQQGLQLTFAMFNPANSAVLARLELLRYLVTTLNRAPQLEELYTGTISLYRITSAPTGGTLLTPRPLDSTDAASPLVVRTIPTGGAALGSLLGQYSVASRMSQFPYRYGNQYTNFIVPMYEHPPASQLKPLTLRPGEGIGVRSDAIQISFNHSGFAHWTEAVS